MLSESDLKEIRGAAAVVDNAILTLLQERTEMVAGRARLVAEIEQGMERISAEMRGLRGDLTRLGSKEREAAVSYYIQHGPCEETRTALLRERAGMIREQVTAAGAAVLGLPKEPKGGDE